MLCPTATRMRQRGAECGGAGAVWVRRRATALKGHRPAADTNRRRSGNMTERREPGRTGRGAQARARRRTIVSTRALEIAAQRTEGGKGIDDEQVHCERLAYAATEVAAARELLRYAAGCGARASATRCIEAMAGALRRRGGAAPGGQIDAHLDEFGLGGSASTRHSGTRRSRTCVRRAAGDESACARSAATSSSSAAPTTSGSTTRWR